jgi:thioredoxin reductase (NADPH)
VLTGAAAGSSDWWPLQESPRELETSMPGVFACGDVRSGTTKRCAFAVGDGALAVTCVHQSLARQPTDGGAQHAGNLSSRR